MAIIETFAGSEIVRPDSYSKLSVEANGGLPLAPSSVLAIVGEALGGAPGAVDGVQSFDSTQLSDLVAKYVSGPLVDDAKAAMSGASKDPDIVNGPSVVRVYKTNPSTQATSTIAIMDDAVTPATILDVTSKNYGLPENQINFYITEGSVADQQFTLTSAPITFPITVAVGSELYFTYQGLNFMFTSPGNITCTTIADVLALFNDAANWAPSKPCVFTATGNTQLTVTVNTALPAFDGYENMHEYGVGFVGGGIADETVKFRNKISFATNGTSAGTFTAASVTNLAVNMWTQIKDNDSGWLNVRIDSITGTVAPFTVTLTDLYGAPIDISGYTTAQSAVIYGGGPVVDLATLDVAIGTGNWGRGSRGSRIVSIKKNSEVETLLENENLPIFKVLYKGAGSAATLTIQVVAGDKKLTTTCTGAASDNLDIKLSDYTTIDQLVDYINNFDSGTKYICYTDYYNSLAFSPVNLDFYNAIDIKTFPLEVKAAIYEIANAVNNNSQFMSVEQVDNIYGQVATISSSARKYLTGAVNGGTTNTLVQNGFDAILTEDCDIVMASFSQDASADISAGVTDASSTYTISSINSIIDSHCRVASNTINKSERLGWCSLKTTYANSKTAARALNSEYVSLVIQDAQTLGSDSTINWQQPHVAAALNAGAEAGSEIGLPLTAKALNANGVRHASFNYKTQFSDAIKAGIYVLEQDANGGVEVMCANTTYQKDSSFVFNRRSVMRAAHYTVKTLRQATKSALVGKTKVGGDTLANTAKAIAENTFGALLRANVLARDNRNGGLGYRNLTTTVVGGTVRINAIITPVQGVDFVFNDIVLATISDLA